MTADLLYLVTTSLLETASFPSMYRVFPPRRSLPRRVSMMPFTPQASRHVCMNLRWGKKRRAPWGTSDISDATLRPMRRIISSLLSLNVVVTKGSTNVRIFLGSWIGG